MASGPLALNGPVWGGDAPLGLPALDGEHTADVCVVGLGGSGLAAIHEALDAGCSVIGLDAGTVAGGAAGRNGGFLLAGMRDFYHLTVARVGRERARALYAATLEQMDRMTAETPDAIRRVGSLRIADSAEERDDCRAQLDAMRADGFAAEWYEGPEGEGLLIPTDGGFDPLRRCRALARQAAARGARLFEQSHVAAVGDGAAGTAQGIVRADRIVVAVDGRLERILPELAPRVRTARLQMLATAPVPRVVAPRPVYARWGYEYWQQLPDGRLALGGFRDAGGEGEWTHDADPGGVVQESLDRLLRERLGITEAVTHRWAASVAYTDDGLPVLEEVRPGVWATGAYSGTGNVVGALCGRAAVRLALGQAAPFAELLQQPA